jgi:hypothetical protein
MEKTSNPAGNPNGLTAWSAEEFIQRQMPPKEPLLQGLLHKRDLVALGARRRHGKTSFVTDLAVALATGAPDFLGYNIPAACRVLLLILEDDVGEFQEKLRKIVGAQNTEGRLYVATREDFFKGGISVNIGVHLFPDAVKRLAASHKPDLIVLDNLSQLVSADYNDPTKIDKVARLCYELARDHNCAVIVPAHPRKEDRQNPIDLLKDSTGFFESIMGSSHFINSMGSLWGLHRDGDVTAFVGGRQRGDGKQAASYLEMDDDGHFQVVSDVKLNLSLACNTDQRRRAWTLLPDPPTAFGYREGHKLVETALKSSSSYYAWMDQCRRLGVVVDASDGKLVKAVESTVRAPRRIEQLAA